MDVLDTMGTKVESIDNQSKGKTGYSLKGLNYGLNLSYVLYE